MSAPFGIELNSSIEGISIVGEMPGNKYQVIPPKPHPAFETYYVQTSPTFGVVWVKGIGPELTNDSFGAGLRAAHEKISTQLQSRYGPPRKTDMLHHGSIWSEPRDWLASHNQNERSFFHLWERPHSSELPGDIETIFLGLLTYSFQDGSVVVEYASDKHKAAEAELEASYSEYL